MSSSGIWDLQMTTIAQHLDFALFPTGMIGLAPGSIILQIAHDCIGQELRAALDTSVAVRADIFVKLFGFATEAKFGETDTASRIFLTWNQCQQSEWAGPTNRTLTDLPAGS